MVETASFQPQPLFGVIEVHFLERASRGSVAKQVAVHAGRVVKEVGTDDGVELVTAEQVQGAALVKQRFSVNNPSTFAFLAEHTAREYCAQAVSKRRARTGD